MIPVAQPLLGKVGLLLGLRPGTSHVGAADNDPSVTGTR